MTTNFIEKQRWVAALEAAVRSVQRKDVLRKSVSILELQLQSCDAPLQVVVVIPFYFDIFIAQRPQMTTVVSLKDPDRKEFNCALVLSSQVGMFFFYLMNIIVPCYCLIPINLFNYLFFT